MPKKLYVVVLVLVVALAVVAPVAAQDATPEAEVVVEEVAGPVELVETDAVLDNKSSAVVEEETPVSDTANGVIMALLALVPVVAVAGPINSVIIDVLKILGVVKDGFAGLANGGLNLFWWLVLAITGALGFGGEVETLIQLFGQIALVIVGMVATASTAKGTHILTKWLGIVKSLPNQQQSAATS